MVSSAGISFSISLFLSLLYHFILAVSVIDRIRLYFGFVSFFFQSESLLLLLVWLTHSRLLGLLIDPFLGFYIDADGERMLSTFDVKEYLILDLLGVIDVTMWVRPD